MTLEQLDREWLSLVGAKRFEKWKRWGRPSYAGFAVHEGIEKDQQRPEEERQVKHEKTRREFAASSPARQGMLKELYLRWHPVTGGYVGQAEICVIASRSPDSDCYTGLNRRVMDHLHDKAIRENYERAASHYEESLHIARRAAQAVQDKTES
jgi:hypothetical protein